MGVNKKGKRKICVENKEYVWYVNEDYDSPYYILNIFSEDKSLIVSCPLKTETAYLISKGLAFQNQKQVVFGIDIYCHFLSLKLLHPFLLLR